MESLSSVSCLGEVLHQEDQTFLSNMEDPICFFSAQSDTMYYEQAMAAHDSHKFREAMIKEIAMHFELRHWEMKEVQHLPPMTKLLDSVWAMKRKRESPPEKYTSIKLA